MSFRLDNQRVVLLGAGSGIGLATAEMLCELGAEVVIASRSAAHVDSALERLPTGTEGHAVDLTSEPATEHLFAQVGEFDHLVYTAGEPPRPFPLTDVDLDDARRFTETRLWGALAALKHGHRNLRPGGSVVLVSGSAAARPRPGWMIGAAVGAAVEAVTRTLALELAPTRVNAVAPGLVRSEMWNGMPESDREAMFAAAARSQPVGRVGLPHDIAQTIAYLIADTYVSGSVTEVNGGANLV